MAKSKVRAAATALNKGAKSLQAIAREIRALDALGSAISEEQRQAAFHNIVGSLRVFRAVTLQGVLDTLREEIPAETEASEG